MSIQINKLKQYLFLTAFALLCAGCGNQTTPGLEINEDYHNDYQETGGEVALVIDVSSVMDNSFNQAAYEGTQTYAQAAGVSYSYYSAVDNSATEYKNAVLDAIENDAKLVICAGSHFEQAVGSLQDDYSDIFFLLLDGVPKDTAGDPVTIAPNVYCITYHEEEAGYLAGYMAVLAGYEKLGFIGGEQLPSVQKYGYGYLQGIDDAASALGISDGVSVDYWYADTFFPSQQIEKISRDWYQAGTQIVFACGGSLYESVLSAAETCGGRLIGADMEQRDSSELFFTFALKGVKSSVVEALDEFYAYGGTWPEEMAGNVISYGAEKKSIELSFPNDAENFENDLSEDYLQILADLKNGNITVSDETDVQPETAVTVIYHNEQQEDNF